MHRPHLSPGPQGAWKAQAALTLTREGETLTAGQERCCSRNTASAARRCLTCPARRATGGDGLTLHLDFLPGWSREDTLTWLHSRRTDLSRQEAGALLTGSVHPRLGRVLCKAGHIRRAAGIGGNGPPAGGARRVRDLALPVTGTCGFDQAQVTAGGLRTGEFDPRTMESRLTAGILRLRRGAGYRRRLRGASTCSGPGPPAVWRDGCCIFNKGEMRI